MLVRRDHICYFTDMGKDPIRFPHKLLVGSVFFFLMGVGMLLVTTGFLPRYGDLWPIPLTLLGLLFLYMVNVKQARSWYIVPGIFFSLGGFLLVLHSVFFPMVSLDRFWPLFMTLAGFGLFMYGRRLSPRGRVAVIVPATVIIILSFLFLPFSLDLIEKDFAQVAASWWPILFLILSAGLFAEFLRKTRE